MSNTIDDLAEQIRKCTKCPLHQSRVNAVPGTGNPKARVMLIGEGPGQNEDKQGKPFVGASGKYLNQLLEKSGLRRSELFVTNVVKCRPPENRDPTQEEKAQCRDWLELQIEAIKPDLVVTMGSPATQHFVPQAKITQIRGRPLRVDNRDFVILPMYHPAAANRQERFREPIEQDFPRIREWIDILNATAEDEADQPVPETPTDQPDPQPTEATMVLEPLARPRNRSSPDSTQPQPGPLLATAQVISDEMRLLLQEEIDQPDRDPRRTRHSLAVLSAIFQATREQARSLPAGPYRDWVQHHLLNARTTGAALGEAVPLTCEQCGAAFHPSSDEMRLERWCPDCREN